MYDGFFKQFHAVAGARADPSQPCVAPHMGTYQHFVHYHYAAPHLPFSTATAEGMVDPTRFGPLPWVSGLHFLHFRLATQASTGHLQTV